MTKIKLAHNLLIFYVTLLSVFMAAGSAALAYQTGNPLTFLFFIPVVIYFILLLVTPKRGHKLLLYYNFILTSILGASGFIGARNIPEIISAALFLPLTLYFWLLVLPKRGHKLEIEPDTALKSLEEIIIAKPEEPKVEPAVAEATAKEPASREVDLDRRTFLKLIGSVGLSVFLLSLFSRKIEDTFFGNRFTKTVPAQANNPPATSPTDGYKISEIDDGVPGYFGFVDAEGQWYIMQETDSGSFRYYRGSKNFEDNWNNRANMTYLQYNQVF